MLKRLIRRWKLGWLLLFNLSLIYILIGIVMFFAFVPAIGLVKAQEDPHMDVTLRAILIGLGIAYGFVVSPLLVPWIVSWKGLPIWTNWDARSEKHGLAAQGSRQQDHT